MILNLVRTGGETFTAVCPPDTKVFNGKDWVTPAVGQYATLIYPRGTLSAIVERNGTTYEQDTTQICLIESVTSNNQVNAVLVQEADPLNGDCPCLVCNLGTQLINVKVTA